MVRRAQETTASHNVVHRFAHPAPVSRTPPQGSWFWDRIVVSLTPCPRPKRKEAACERTFRSGRTISRPGYRQGVELRQIEAFVAVATDLAERFSGSEAASG